MTATLDKTGRLSQEAFVTRDCLARRLAPTKPLGPLEPGAAGTSRVSREGRGGPAQRIGVPVCDQLPRIAHDLGQAGVLECRHRAAARYRLQAWQPETLVPAWKQQAAGGRVEVGQLSVVHLAEPVG